MGNELWRKDNPGRRVGEVGTVRAEGLCSGTVRTDLAVTGSSSHTEIEVLVDGSSGWEVQRALRQDGQIAGMPGGQAKLDFPGMNSLPGVPS